MNHGVGIKICSFRIFRQVFRFFAETLDNGFGCRAGRNAAVAAQLLRLDDAELRVRYRLQLLRVLRARWKEPHILFIYALKVSLHYHFAAIARALRQVSEAKGAMQAAGRLFSRVKPRIEGQAAA